MIIGKDCKLALTLEKSLMEFSGGACDQSGRLAASALSVPLVFFSMEKDGRGGGYGIILIKTQILDIVWSRINPQMNFQNERRKTIT